MTVAIAFFIAFVWGDVHLTAILAAVLPVLVIASVWQMKVGDSSLLAHLSALLARPSPPLAPAQYRRNAEADKQLCSLTQRLSMGSVSLSCT